MVFSAAQLERLSLCARSEVQCRRALKAPQLIGARPGHAAAKRPLVAKPDRVIEVNVAQCANCQSDLQGLTPTFSPSCRRLERTDGTPIAEQRLELMSEIAELLDGCSSEMLILLIDTHIATGEPVGSRAISSRTSEGLSSATVRNIISDLVEAGYLEQPHTQRLKTCLISSKRKL